MYCLAVLEARCPSLFGLVGVVSFKGLCEAARSVWWAAGNLWPSLAYGSTVLSSAVIHGILPPGRGSNHSIAGMLLGL